MMRTVSTFGMGASHRFMILWGLRRVPAASLSFFNCRNAATPFFAG
jgi:hypothetical protein